MFERNFIFMYDKKMPNHKSERWVADGQQIY